MVDLEVTATPLLEFGPTAVELLCVRVDNARRTKQLQQPQAAIAVQGDPGQALGTAVKTTPTIGAFLVQLI